MSRMRRSLVLALCLLFVLPLAFSGLALIEDENASPGELRPSALSQPEPLYRQATALLQETLRERSAARELQAAWRRLDEAGSYAFASTIDQTYLPRAVPEMIGESEQRVRLVMSGDVQLPDRAEVSLWVEGGGESVSPVTLYRDGNGCYMRQGGQIEPVSDPLGAILPSNDWLAYLAAAENVRELPVEGDGSAYAFDIDGERLAEYVRQQAEDAARRDPGTPSELSYSTSSVLSSLSGDGELWLDATGMPIRQVVNISVPRLNSSYDVEMAMVVELGSFGCAANVPDVVQGSDGGWSLQAPAQSASVQTGPAAGVSNPLLFALPLIATNGPAGSVQPMVNIAPSALALFAACLLLFALIRLLRRQWRRAYAIIATLMCLLMIVTPMLRMGQYVRYGERTVQAAEARAEATPNLLRAMGLDVGEGSAEVETSSDPDSAHVPDERKPQPTEPAPEVWPTDPQSTVPGDDPVIGLLSDFVKQDGNEDLEATITRCGQGSPDVDSDADGLNDQLEGCLGTDPYLADTDGDGISDGSEVHGFDYAGLVWYGDPHQVDTNRDGRSDFLEWPEPEGQATTVDLDGDDLPDLWDDDDDGDGVPDHLDLSPTAYTAVQDELALTLNQAKSHDATTYVEFNLRPENEAHLRYATTWLDWPYDENGNVTVYTDGQEDLRLTPFAVVHSNHAPSDEIAGKYGFATWETSSGDHVLLVPLMPVEEYGAVHAFYGKIAFDPAGPGAPSEIELRTEMTWMAQAQVNRLVNCYDPSEPEISECTVVTQTQVLHQYSDRFACTGLQVTKSDDYEFALWGKQVEPAEDKELFQIQIGLTASFLSYGELEYELPGQTTLEHAEYRFHHDYPLTYTWGVERDLVHAEYEAVTEGHHDAGLAAMSERANAMLDGLYAGNICQDLEGEDHEVGSLVIAYEEQLGVGDLSEMAVAGDDLSISMRDVAMLAMRGVRLAMYEKTALDGWQVMPASAMLAIVEARYADRYETMLDAYYPNLSAEEMRFIGYMGYLALMTGNLNVVSVDGTDLVPSLAQEIEIGSSILSLASSIWGGIKTAVAVFGALSGTAEALDDVLDESKIVWHNNPLYQESDNWSYNPLYEGKDDWDYNPTYQPAKVQEVSRIQRFGKWAGKVALWGGAVVTVAGFVLAGINVACSIDSELAVCRSQEALQIADYAVRGLSIAVQTASLVSTAIKTATKTIEPISKAGAALAVVGLVIGIAVTWVQFGLVVGFTDSPMALKMALATAIVTTVWLAVLFAINFIPLVGQLITAIIGLIDTLISLFTLIFAGDQWNIARVLTELFYSVKQLTELKEAPTFDGWGSRLDDPDLGLVAGNTYRMTSTIHATMVITNKGSEDDLDDSWAKGETTVPITQAIYGSTPLDTEAGCRVVNGELECENQVGVGMPLTQARINQPIVFEVLTIFQYVYGEYGLFGAAKYDTDTDIITLPAEDDRGYTTFYLDVLPTTLDALWSWSEIDNPDPDGDGLLDETMAAYLAGTGTSPELWDTDGDGLGDGWEWEQQATLGCSPLQADSDGDGLSDRIELRFGTRCDDSDTDGDGLLDGEEVHHQVGPTDWVGGWDVTLPGGEAIKVLSSARRGDWDADGRPDGEERLNGLSPYAFNGGPMLWMDIDPLAGRPGYATGVYAQPGDQVSFDVYLISSGVFPITDTMTLNIPATLGSLDMGLVYGDREPAVALSAVGGGDSQLALDMSGEATLQRYEQISFTLGCEVVATGAGSYTDTLTLELPYAGTLMQRQVEIIVDQGDPEVALETPLDGAVLNGGSFVVGGSAWDETSWVTEVEFGITTPGDPIVGYVPADGISPWAYSWSLPSDGVYEINARATDYLGHQHACAPATVIVDNTPPEVSLSASNYVSTTTDVVHLEGTATDNLSGVRRAQISVNGQPWRVVMLEWSDACNATWSYAWPLGTHAQGSHWIRLRGHDQAGNVSAVAERTVIVDRVPPSDALADRTYLEEPPAVPVGQAHTLVGVADEGGHLPDPIAPQTLLGADKDVLDDADVWLGLSTIADNDDGVQVAWLGDVNNDRMADLVVGLPAALDGAGQVVLVHGRPGDWVTPPGLDMLASSPSLFDGGPGARLGQRISAAGDVNGDGLQDLLIGEANSPNVYLLFGRPGPMGHWTLDGGVANERPLIIAPSNVTDMAPAGDVSDDGYDDLLITAGGAVYLLLGHDGTWPASTTLSSQAALYTSSARSALGVGDMDGDGIGDWVVAGNLQVALFCGDGSLAAGATQSRSIGAADYAFVSSEISPKIAAVGDMTGDGYPDLVYSSGTDRNVVRGGATPWVAHVYSGYSGAFSAVGDVDGDGYCDLLLGDSGDEAKLMLGADTLGHLAALSYEGVGRAADAPYAAGADINADGSSDLLLVPSGAEATARGLAALSFGGDAFISPAGLPLAAGDGGVAEGAGTAVRRALQSERKLMATADTFHVDDDYALGASNDGHTWGVDAFATITDAVSAADNAGDTILVHPGVYQETVSIGSGKGHLKIRGVDADAVFIDGRGGSAAVQISVAMDVLIADVTLRNAENGLTLMHAGYKGYNDLSRRIKLRRVVVHSCDHAISMDRQSTLRLQDCTLVGSGNSADTMVLVDSAPDPDLAATWQELTTVPEAIGDEGLLTNAGGTLYAFPGGGSENVYRYNVAGDSWSSETTTPRNWQDDTLVGGAPDGTLYQLNPDIFGGFNGNVYAIHYVSANEIYVGGDFTKIGSASISYLALWDGSSWSSFASGADRPDGCVRAIAEDSSGRLWVGMESSWQPVRRWNGSSWTTWSFGVHAGVGGVPHCYALATSGNRVYVGGDFYTAEGISSNNVICWTGTNWERMGSESIYGHGVCNGAWDTDGFREGACYALAVDSDNVYVGGQFVGGCTSAGTELTSILHASRNFVILDRTTNRWQITGGAGYDSSSVVNVLKREPDLGAIYLGGRFFGVSHGYTNYKDASNLAVWDPGSDDWGGFVYSPPNYDSFGTNSSVYSMDVERISGVIHVYVGGLFTSVGDGTPARSIARFRAGVGNAWNALGSGVDGAVDPTVRSVAFAGGGTVYAGGTFTVAGGGNAQHFARYANAAWSGSTLFSYDGSSWTQRAMPEFAWGMGAIGGLDDGFCLLLDNNRTFFYTLSTDGWEQLAFSYDDINSGRLALTWTGTDLWALAGSKMYRYYDSSGWHWRGDTRSQGTGSALAPAGSHDPDGAYAFLGGGDDKWSYLPLGDFVYEEPQTEPALGWDLANGHGLAERENSLYLYASQTTAPSDFYCYGEMGLSGTKLWIEGTVFVDPQGDDAPPWCSIDPASAPDDFQIDVDSETGWVSDDTFAPDTSSGYTVSVAGAAWLAPNENIWRVGVGSGVTSGYYTPVGEVFVYPTREDCVRCNSGGDLTWEETAFGNLQDAVDSGAQRILVTPGVYPQRSYLVNGVEVLGAGAEWTLLQAAAGEDAPMLRAEGVAAVSLGNLSVVGNGSTVGIQMEDGASATVARTILRDNDTGLLLSGGDTQVEVVNNTIAYNGDGLRTANGAPLNARNTLFAYNSGTGLDYSSGANTYNLFWANGIDSDPVAVGGGNVTADPLFVAPLAGNCRLGAHSAAIDAGNPGDPAPPGAGAAVDIGYREYGRASYYVDDDYSEFGLNDGLTWQVDAFDTIGSAVEQAEGDIPALAAPNAGSIAGLTVFVAAGTYVETVDLPSYIHLAGVGADEVTLDADGQAVGIKLDGVVRAQVSGLRVRRATYAGVSILGASNQITLTRNLLVGNGHGVALSERSTAALSFNTLADNSGSGVLCSDTNTRAAVRNSMLTGNNYGLRVVSGGEIESDYNLLSGNASGDVSGVAAGDHTLNVAPGYGSGYYLSETSPAVDAADPWAPIPAGGGTRADIGYRELYAAPLGLFFGPEINSALRGNSGVAQVDLGTRRVSDPSTPVTDTLPTGWGDMTPASGTPPVWVWDGQMTPTQEGLYRIYTRATDALGNSETDEEDWYEGAVIGDSTPPQVDWVWPTGATTTGEAAVRLVARTKDYVDAGDGPRFNVETIAFVVDSVSYAAQWVDDAAFDAEAQTWRTYAAWVPLGTGAHTVQAVARDCAGNLAQSASRSITVSGGNQITVTSHDAAQPVNRRWVDLAGVARLAGDGAMSLTVQLGAGTPVDAVVEDAWAPVARWSARVQLSNTDGLHTLSLEAERGGQTASLNHTIELDRVAPATLNLIEPAAGSYVTQTVQFAGNAADAESGLARVDVSMDGGYTWRTANESGGAFDLAWDVTGWQDYVSHPAAVRAVDAAGNGTVVERIVTVDCVPPTGIAPVTFSAEPGSRLERLDALDIDWTAASDASGTVTTHFAVDQAPDTSPTAPAAGTHHTAVLNAVGEWYVHLAARDVAGNELLYHYGPWHVNDSASGTLAGRQRNIIVDGLIDLGGDEWVAATDLLDDDERPDPDQRLYVAWDGDALYLGWQTAWWDLDGTLWVYLDLAPGGSTLPVQPLAGVDVLPFGADYALQVDGVDDGTLWVYGGGAWGAQALEFAQGSNGDTEIRLPWDATTVTSLNLVATAVDNMGVPWSSFPTANPLDLGVSLSGDRSLTDVEMAALVLPYHWDSLLASQSIPNAGQPQGECVTLALSSPQASDGLWGPGETLDYVLTVVNHESETVSGLGVALAASPGLGLTALDAPDGGTCSNCPANGMAWELALPALSAGQTLVMTVAGTLADAGTLAGIDAVSVAAELTPGANLLVLDQAGDSATHSVDATPPSLTIDSQAGQALAQGLQTLSGTASDGGGSGVSAVYARAAGGVWQPTTGGVSWSIEMDIPGASPTFELGVYAVDARGNARGVVSQTFVVDITPPVLQFSPPTYVRNLMQQFEGTTYDPQPTGAHVALVEMQVDGAGPWFAAHGPYAPDEGVQPWNITWLAPLEDGVPHTLQTRATDGAGLMTTAPPVQVIVDNVPPALTVTESQRIESIRVTDYLGSSLFAERGIQALGPPVLCGTVGDGGGLSQVIVWMYTPDSRVVPYLAPTDGSSWCFTPVFTTTLVGLYTLWVEPFDLAGNSRMTGPFPLVVRDEPGGGLTVSNDSPTMLYSPTTLTAVVTSGTNLTYTWDLGDGQVGYGATVEHAYPSLGVFTATVTVSNTENTMSDQTVVTIVEPNGEVGIEPLSPTGCAGWHHTFWISYTNVSSIPMHNVVLTVDNPGRTLVVPEACSPGVRTPADRGSATWNLGTVAPGAGVQPKLVLQFFSSIPHETDITVPVLVTATGCDPLTDEAIVQVRTDGICEGTQPPDPTPSPTPVGRLALPLIARSHSVE